MFLGFDNPLILCYCSAIIWANSHTFSPVLIWWSLIVKWPSSCLHWLLFVYIWASWITTKILETFLIVAIAILASIYPAEFMVGLIFQYSISCMHLWVGGWLWGIDWLVVHGLVSALCIIVCKLLVDKWFEHGVIFVAWWVWPYHLRMSFNLVYTFLKDTTSIWIFSCSLLRLFLGKAWRESTYSSMWPWFDMVSPRSCWHSWCRVFNVW